MKMDEVIKTVYMSLSYYFTGLRHHAYKGTKMFSNEGLICSKQDQVFVFYTCSHIPGLYSGTALARLPIACLLTYNQDQHLVF